MKRVGLCGGRVGLLLLVACAHAAAHAPRWPCRAGAERFEASTCRRAPPAMKETTLDRLTGPKLFKTVKRTEGIHAVPLRSCLSARSAQARQRCRPLQLAADDSLEDYLADPFRGILGEDADDADPETAEPSTQPQGLGVMSQVLFVECGFGCDQHGQDPTKAVVRACRNAIEFNSIPSIRRIVPGGYDSMKLHVQVGVPSVAQDIDLERVAAVFPYGTLLPITIQRGGLLASSGIVLPEMGDKNDDMIIAVACVTVGY